MPPNVVMSATMQCSFGMAPSTLVTVPTGPPVVIEGRPAATIADIVPAMNIPPFAMCQSLANPAVAAATAAAMGTLTPMPCVPAIAGPWQPGAAKTLVNGKPALTAGSTCNCVFGGLITITNFGANKTLSN
jgi:hypothetical protein